jgi:small subunit ribosomal protein S17
VARGGTTRRAKRRTKEERMSGSTERKEKIGVVVSDKMRKTVVVRVDRLVRHLRYKRTIRLSKTYKVHDEQNTSHIGDTVKIRETRPLSAQKYHTLVSIVTRAKVKPEEALKEADQV